MVELDVAVAKMSHECQVLEEQRDEVDQQFHNLECQSNDIQRDIQSQDTALRQLESARSDRLLAYGNAMVKLVKAINENRSRWTGELPRGPIGLYISVRREYKEFAYVVEERLKNLLTSFVVDNIEDQKKLQNLANQMNAWIRIIVPGQRHHDRNFDFTSGEPHPSFLTIHRAIEVSDEVILRQLVLQNNIECTVLVKTRREGDAMTERGNPPKVKHIFTMDNIQMGGSRGGLMTKAGNYNKNGARFLVCNPEESIREHRSNLELLHQQLVPVIESLERQRAVVNNLSRQIDELKRNIHAANADRGCLQDEIRRLEEELEDNGPANIASLMNFKRDADELVEGYKLQLLAVQERKTRLKADEAELKQSYVEIKKELELVEQNHQRISNSLMKTMSDSRKIESQIQAIEAKMASYAAELNRLNGEEEIMSGQIAESTRNAMEICNGIRFRVSGTRDSIERNIADCEIQLRENRKKTGVSEEVVMRLKDASGRLQEAKREIAQGKSHISSLWKSAKLRRRRYLTLREMISIRAKNLFTVNLNKRGYAGQLILNHQAETLDLKVDVHHGDIDEVVMVMERNTSKGRGKGKDKGRLSVAASSYEKDPRTLSGGEKSFSTVCLLLSLWQGMGNPFRALDEFDVFMDAVNRKISMNLMVENARMGRAQYIFITPQDMSNVSFGTHDIRVVRLRDPERNQSLLPFVPCPLT